MARYRSVDPSQSFPELELQILERWRERDIFHESVRRREGSPEYVFYEGPPTANGPPFSHHVLSRVFKDVFPRFKTMRGHQVHRKGGWDCHGLPVELQIERKLGFHHKDDIERYGVAEFNQQCRESVLEYIDEWARLTERIAFWVDTDDAYFTLEDDYIESVWWSLKQVWDKQLLYEGHKVVPYCTRCGTARLSRGRGPVPLPALPDRWAGRRFVPRVDDHAVDAPPSCGTRRRPGGRLRARPRGWRGADPGGRARRASAG
jgi:isoleucyl-tRNA synthetase